MLRLVVIALIWLAAAAGLAIAQGLSPPAGARARLWLLPSNPHDYATFDLNEDRDVLFVATSENRSTPGRQKGKNGYVAAYTLSDPAHPIELFRIALGDGTIGRPVPRYDRLFVSVRTDRVQEPLDEILIFDLRKRTAPVLRGRLPIGSASVPWISADGLTIAFYEWSVPSHTKRLRSFDLERPEKPREIDASKVDLPSDFVEPPLWEDRDRFERLLSDRLGNFALSYGRRRFQLWRTSEYGPPELIREIGDSSERGAVQMRAKIGAGAAFAVTQQWEGIEIISLEEPTASASSLRQAYRFLTTGVPGARLRREAQNKSPASLDVLQWAAALMESAGVSKLLKGPIDGLAQSETQEILSAYGVWLDAAADSVRALPFLQAAEFRVHSASSAADVARAAHRAVAQSATWKDKVEFSEAALEATRVVKARSGAWPSDIPDLEKLHIQADSGMAVCDYVRAFNSAGRLDEVTASIEGSDVVNDGGKTQVNLHRDRRDNVWLTQRRGSPPVDFYAAGDDDETTISDILAVPFGRTTYILYMEGAKPTALSLANTGLLCTFS